MKKFSIALAAIAVVGSGCRDDQTSEQINQMNANTIGFTSVTTRADLTDLSDLMGDKAGFKVYATESETPSSWMSNITGNNNYGYADGAWGWVNVDVSWPTDEDSYPINFYAYYSSDYTNMAMNVLEPTAVTMTYTPSSDITKQVDILSATAKADSRPAGDKVSLYFGHILSRVNFSTTAGSESTVHIQSVALNNALNKQNYEVLSDSWSDASGAGSQSYTFLSTTNPATAFEGTDESSSSAVSSDAGYLMLLPQTTT
ncbi:MAG: fimbrillin family protein, partial [Rikenellaceae bacterium]